MKEVSKTYCRVPFDSVTISPTGRFQMCCEAQWTETINTEKNKLKDVDTLEQWFDSKYLQNVRKSMLQGNALPECETCYKNEKLYNQSSRLEYNKNFQGDEHEQSIKKIDIKFGNKCNLKCKMCFPYASSELWKEWKELGWNSKEKDPNNDTSWKYFDGYFEEDYAWPKNASNIDKIKQAAIKTKLLHVTGGEPTINPEFFQLLKHCIDKDVAKDIVLEVTTNATKIHPKFFDMVSQFKQVILTISMDGVGKTYEYVRFPANYDVVHKNIVQYNKFIKRLGNGSILRFNFVMQFWNVHNAIDVIKTLAPLSFNHSDAPVMIEILNDPKFMHWKMLPEDIIQKTIKDLAKEMLKHPPKHIKWCLIALAEKLKRYRSIKSNELMQDLVKFTTVQDKHRKINLKDYIPELVSSFSV